ncbi:MAG: hypothetical protein M1482_16060 [Chloroflexi bacterium]|nr:hypothetical protein [Chloroflexota bacterium]
MIQKFSDEGSTHPFTARLFFGILQLRDVMLSRREGGATVASARAEFDALYSPVLNALHASRAADLGIHGLLAEHQRKLAAREIVSFQGDTLDLGESINQPLRDEVSKLLVNGTIAIKASQNVTKRLGVPIACVFERDASFEKGKSELTRLGHPYLAEYLNDIRKSWSAAFIDRRNASEHRSWSLPDVEYIVSYPTLSVELIEPQIDGTPVGRYSTVMLGRVITFVEDVITYAFKLAIGPPLIIVEIPKAQRDPSSPQRFRVAVHGQCPEWVPAFSDSGFP